MVTKHIPIKGKGVWVWGAVAVQEVMATSPSAAWRRWNQAMRRVSVMLFLRNCHSEPRCIGPSNQGWSACSKLIEGKPSGRCSFARLPGVGVQAHIGDMYQDIKSNVRACVEKHANMRQARKLMVHTEGVRVDAGHVAIGGNPPNPSFYPLSISPFARGRGLVPSPLRRGKVRMGVPGKAPKRSGTGTRNA